MTRDPVNPAEETMHGPPSSSGHPPPSPCAEMRDPCTGLADLRERTLSDLMTLQQRIDRAKRALWALTAAPRPDSRRIEATMTEIADLQREQQEYFTTAVATWMTARCEACRAEPSRHAGSDGTRLADELTEHDDDEKK